MTKTIRREVLFPQPREQVWRAIADRAGLAEWMFPNDFEPRVGHRFTHRGGRHFTLLVKDVHDLAFPPAESGAHTHRRTSCSVSSIMLEK